MPVARPKPKARTVSWNGRFATRSAVLIVPTLLDLAITSRKVRSPNGLWSEMRVFASVMAPISQSKRSSGSTRPASSAAAAVTILKVEPGS